MVTTTTFQSNWMDSPMSFFTSFIVPFCAREPLDHSVRQEQLISLRPKHLREGRSEEGELISPVQYQQQGDCGEGTNQRPVLRPQECESASPEDSRQDRKISDQHEVKSLLR